MFCNDTYQKSPAYDKDGSYKVWGPLAVYIMARDKWRGTLSAYRIGTSASAPSHIKQTLILKFDLKPTHII